MHAARMVCAFITGHASVAFSDHMEQPMGGSSVYKSVQSLFFPLFVPMMLTSDHAFKAESNGIVNCFDGDRDGCCRGTNRGGKQDNFWRVTEE